MKTDHTLPENIQGTITGAPLLNNAFVRVMATDGLTAPNQILDRYVRKSENEEALKHAFGVKDVNKKNDVPYGKLYKRVTTILPYTRKTRLAE